ncbi:MAG: CrcB family protein [Phycisphaerales bacterium]|nr:CrcB family protein [Phycisphaerales bacterium]
MAWPKDQRMTSKSPPTLPSIWLMLAVVFGGGTMGTMLRYGAEQVCPIFQADPWVAVLVVNLLATFFAAWVGRKYLILSRGHFVDVVDPFHKKNPLFNLFFVSGCMGGLSTFSSLAQELMQQLTRGDLLQCGLNLGLSLVLGFAAGAFGLRLGQATS